jgi:lipopolysaccharide biosynthesis glycosyltransferase
LNRTSREGCITTVTDEGFLPGTIVLLASFLRHNPWFTGDIVIIHDGLADAARARLQRFPNLRFHAVGGALTDRLKELAAARPKIAAKLPVLRSLEAFNLPGYDWVLKLDSDVLCTGSAADLIGIEGALLGSPDQAYFRDQVRHLQTYVPQHKALGSPEKVYAMTFNAGILLLRPGQLDSRVHAGLIDRVHADTWSMVRTGHSDSVVLNRHFRDSWTAVPEKYNYVMSRDASRYKRARIALGDAVFLHYVGRPKPWDAEAAGAVSTMDAERRLAYELWDAEWRRSQGSAVTPPPADPSSK